MFKLSALKLKPRNPRKITDEALQCLAESIQRDPEFMVLRPIVYDADGTVYGGNQRLRAIRDILKRAEVPDNWVQSCADLSQEQKDRFLLVDNAPDGMAGVWDMELLLTDFDIPLFVLVYRYIIYFII